MTRTLLTRSLHLFAGVALIAGASMTLFESSMLASVGGGDMALVQGLLPGNAELRQGPIQIDPLAQAEAAVRLTVGILLIVLGFFAHGLARFREERPVHITVAPAKKRAARWFWMEMRV